MTKRPEIKDDPIDRLLRDGGLEEFNARQAVGEDCDLRGCDLHTTHVRKLHAKSLDLRCQANLAGRRPS